jgi:hypothetical protein
MNKTNIPEPDLDNLLKRTFKDDLPPEAEAKMNRQFLSLEGILERTQSLAEADEWPWHRLFRKDILAVASAAMMILGLVMQLRGSQTALAHTIEKLKVIVTISGGLNRTSSMDCLVLRAGADGEQTSYHVRWHAAGDARVDMVSADGAQTLWISDETVSIAGHGGGDARSMSINTMTPGPVWQPALEFLSPKILAKHMEQRYGLMQTGERRSAGSIEFLIVGREDGEVVEITVDAKTYLPKVLRKYALDSGRTNAERICLTEARFLWDQPISPELFVPGPLAGNQ